MFDNRNTWNVRHSARGNLWDAKRNVTTTFMFDSRSTWNVQNIAPAAESYTPTSLHLHQKLRLPRKETLQLPQISQLPRKMTVQHHDAPATKSDITTSPNTAPVTKGDRTTFVKLNKILCVLHYCAIIFFYPSTFYWRGSHLRLSFCLTCASLSLAPIMYHLRLGFCLTCA